MALTFDSDRAKALRNVRRHGVSFAEAATVFVDDNRLEDADLDHSDTEPRLRVIGLSARGRLLTVICTAREDSDGHTIVRLISARRATRTEIHAYVRP